jgi:hypothetical protein
MNTNFNIKKFDMNMIVDRCDIESKKSPVIVLIGKTDTGKSFLVRDIFAKTQECFRSVGTVISPTEVADPFFQDFIPAKLIKDKYDPSIVANVIKRQTLVKSHRAQQIRDTGSSNVDPRAFLVFDDCLYDKSWVNEETTRYLFMNGRHVNILTLITMQYPLGITPNLRTNIGFVFILRENVTSNRKRIYENYAGMFSTFEMFCRFMDSCTENYECLVICNGVQSNRLEDQVFWYKAESHPPFKLCDDSLWMDNIPLVSSYATEGDYDPSQFRKKNNPWINVKKLN